MLVGFAAIISVGVFSVTNTAEASQEEVPGMMGHITLVLKDSDGNIKEYVQTDNAVTDTGRNCLSENLTNINAACAAGLFTFIGLGTNTALSGENVGTPLTGTCVRSDASDGGTGDVATSAGTTTEVVTMQVIFGGATSTGAGVVSANCQATISEAGLFNSVTPAADQMFAYQTFGGITLLTADTLTVTWVINVT